MPKTIQEINNEIEMAICLRDLSLLCDELSTREKNGPFEDSLRAYGYLKSLRFAIRILDFPELVAFSKELPVVEQFKAFVASLEKEQKRQLASYIEEITECDCEPSFSVNL